MLTWGEFSGLSLANHLHIWSWCAQASLSQDGFQLVSSPSFCPSPRLRAFSVHVLGREIHKNAPSQVPVFLLVSHLEASAGDQLQLLSLGPIYSYLNMAISTYTEKAFGKFQQPYMIKISLIKSIYQKKKKTYS